MTVTPTDLGTYLGQAVDPDRAQLLIDMAVGLCESIVTPLPDAADAVVLDVVTRAFVNPANAETQTAGPFAAGFGAVGGGLWLTRQNKAALRRLSGSGGAFTIDTMPVTAATSLPSWEVNNWGSSGVYGSGWDQTP